MFFRFCHLRLTGGGSGNSQLASSKANYYPQSAQAIILSISTRVRIYPISNILVWQGGGSPTVIRLNLDVSFGSLSIRLRHGLHARAATGAQEAPGAAAGWPRRVHAPLGNARRHRLLSRGQKLPVRLARHGFHAGAPSSLCSLSVRVLWPLRPWCFLPRSWCRQLLRLRSLSLNCFQPRAPLLRACP